MKGGGNWLGCAIFFLDIVDCLSGSDRQVAFFGEACEDGPNTTLYLHVFLL